MAGLFDAPPPTVDMTQPPTLAPRARPRPVMPGVISSPFVEPERPAAIGAVMDAVDDADKDARLLRAVTVAGRFGISDADLSLATGFPLQTICSTRARVRHQLWIARRVIGAYAKAVRAWRIATPEEQARNEAHERQLAAAGQRWAPIDPRKDPS